MALLSRENYPGAIIPKMEKRVDRFEKQSTRWVVIFLSMWFYCSVSLIRFSSVTGFQGHFLFVQPVRRTDHFQRHRSLQAFLLGAVNHSHPAARDFSFEEVVAKLDCLSVMLG